MPFTINYGLEIPPQGSPAQRNNWGNMENEGRTLVDTALGGVEPFDISGSGVTILTSTDGAPDQSRYAHYNFTGALIGVATVLWPQSKGRMFSVTNNTTGAFSLLLGANNGSGVAAGATVTIPQGISALCYSDGTNVKVRQLGFIGTQPGPLTIGGVMTAFGGFSDGGGAVGYTTSGFNIVASFSVSSISCNIGSPTATSFSVICRTAGVVLNDGGNVWNSLCDETMKTKLTPFVDALDKVSQIKVGTGRYLADAEGVSRSFFSAQSLQKVLPEAVTVFHANEMHTETDHPHSAWDGKLIAGPTDIIPLLIAALQEARDRISVLEARP